jgi:hypothetical protein
MQDGNYNPKNSEEDKLKRVLADSTFDYRLAFLHNELPQRSEVDGQYHWSDKTPDGKWLKSPKHPTAWKQVFYEKTGMNPDEIPMMKQEDADKIFVREGLKPTGSYLPKDWKPIKLKPEYELKFRKWLKNTDWFKELP